MELSSFRSESVHVGLSNSRIPNSPLVTTTGCGYAYPVESVPKLAHRTWGQRVRKARNDAGLTQVALALLVDVEQNTISRIETGTTAPSDELKVRLCLALGEPLDHLFSWPEGILEIARYRKGAA